MIVFNLGCDEGHRFDGWFASAGDYASQRQRGLLECPICGDKSITKHLSAPRINRGAAAPAAAGDAPAAQQANVPVTAEAAERTRMLAAQTAFYRHLASMLERSDDVGDRFPEEARRIHYKEAPERQIHGVATREQTVELLEEGVAVLPLPFKIPRKDELN
jgi:hypothetical protein